MHAEFSNASRFQALPAHSPEKLEYIAAVKARRVYSLLTFERSIAIPATVENDEILSSLCLLKSLCDRRGYLIKTACTIEKGPCPFVSIGNHYVGWEFLPSPERFWIKDDYDRLNPVPVDSKLARILRDGFNEQCLENLNRMRTAVLPITSAWLCRINRKWRSRDAQRIPPAMGALGGGLPAQRQDPRRTRQGLPLHREALRCAHHETRAIRSSLFRMLNWLRADLRKATA